MSRRSYLDALDPGGRWPHGTLEQLNRCLQVLEERLGRSREDEPERLEAGPPAADDGNTPQREPAAGSVDAPLAVPQRPFGQRGTSPKSHQSMARDTERLLGEEDGGPATGSMAGELMEVREELRQRMTAGLRGDVQALRRDIERAYAQHEGGDTHGLGHEFERIFGAVRSLAERSDEAGLMLSHELEEVGAELEKLARNEAMSPADRRGVAEGASAGGADPQLSALADRLEEIGKVVANLPESLSLSSLDEKLRALATAIEHLVSRPPSVGPETFAQIELRLDEISRAIVASTIAAQSPHVDPEPFQRIEARIAALARHIEEVAEGRPMAEVMERLSVLSARIEELARRTEMPEKSVEQLTAQIAAIAEKIDRAPALPDTDAILSGIGQRFDRLSDLVARLAEDFKALEMLARRSDERNSRTFEAIHDTLLKIVERLGSMESGTGADVGKSARLLEQEHAPSTAPAGVLSGDPLPGAGQEAALMPEAGPERSPAEAAAAAAAASLDSPEAPPAVERRGIRSMFGGLFSGRKEHEALAPSEPEAEGGTPAEAVPPVVIDEPLDPRIANRPLEPGSGAPDLNAIMRRVRDERGQSVKPDEADAAKSDFIAAARRAAQAAAAEAEVLKRKSEIAGPVKALRIGDLLKSRRKQILMAGTGIALALGGLQLGKAFMVDPVETAGNPPPLIAAGGVGTAALGSAPGKVEERVAEAVAGPAPTGNGGGTGVPAAVPQAPLGQEPEAGVPGIPAAVTVQSVPAQPSASVEVPVGPAALRQAAGSGDPRALFEVASRLAEGRGTGQDLAEAAKWFEKAAELGLAPAQFRIGNFYEKGLGVPRDTARSRTWYQRAAKQGNASAMHNLAVLLAMGADGTADNEKAAGWFALAAELGVRDSQFNLGVLAAKGVGMPQNLEESYKWFALAAKGGDADAAGKRDEIAGVLSAEQLEKARAATELWTPKPLDAAANEVEIPDAWLGRKDSTAVDLKEAIGSVQLGLDESGFDAGSPDGDPARIAAQFQNPDVVDPALVRTLLARE